MNLKYATVSTIEIQTLTKQKASGSVWSVVMALNTFAMGKTSCFPSITTIKEFLGGTMSVRTIHAALKWLADRGHIQRNDKRSKQRFILRLREKAYAGVKQIKRTVMTQDPARTLIAQGPARKQKQTKKTFFRKRTQSRLNRSPGNYCLPRYQDDKRTKIEVLTDEALGRISWLKRDNKDAALTSDELNAIRRRVESDKEWGNWLSEYQPMIYSTVINAMREDL